MAAGAIKPGSEWRMDVTDGTGLPLSQLDFTVSKSPAATQALGK